MFEDKPIDIEQTANLLKFEIMVNKQSVFENLTPILNMRYWTTDVYKSTYFNEFVFHCLRQNILSKVTVNGMSGSSWKSRRFVMLNLKVLNLDRGIIK